MKRAGLVALVVMALSSAALAASKEKASGAKAEILRLDAEWARAAEAGDLEKTLAYWSDDASVFPPGSPALVASRTTPLSLPSDCAHAGVEMMRSDNATAMACGNLEIIRGPPGFVSGIRRK